VLPSTIVGATSGTGFVTTFLCAEVALCMLFGSHAHLLGHVHTHSRLIKLLRRLRLLISPAYHKVHHAGPHDVRYCVINGWANPFCDRMGLWRVLESLVFVVTGAVPRHNDREWWERFLKDLSFMGAPIPSLLELRADTYGRVLKRNDLEP
jgi:hypothetical protein